MIRTTEEAVKKIIEVDERSVSDITPFIETASSIVDDVCTDSAYTSTKLELIERWLSAHFYAVRDPRATQEMAKGVGATYESKVDLGLNNTRYGQQAMAVDTLGSLAAWNKSMVEGHTKASMAWLGRPLSEQRGM